MCIRDRRYELAKSAMQGYCIALGINDDSETYDDIAIGSLRVADAVSYTHLDVYKRQQLHRIV